MIAYETLYTTFEQPLLQVMSNGVAAGKMFALGKGADATQFGLFRFARRNTPERDRSLSPLLATRPNDATKNTSNVIEILKRRRLRLMLPQRASNFKRASKFRPLLQPIRFQETQGFHLLLIYKRITR